MKLQNSSIIALLVISISFLSIEAQAGVNDYPLFVEPAKYNVGVETELTFGDDTGLAATGRYTQGISDLVNVGGILGTGGGNRRFRIGGFTVFDFFPDYDGQPGIGMAFQAIYIRGRSTGALELTVIPYIQKQFNSEGGQYNPFVGIPIGYSSSSSNETSFSHIVMGSSFKLSEYLHALIELGITILESESYFSAGLVYRP